MIVELRVFHPTLSHLQFSVPHAGSFEGLVSFQEGRGQSILGNGREPCPQHVFGQVCSLLDHLWARHLCVCLDLTGNPGVHQDLSGECHQQQCCLVDISWLVGLRGAVLNARRDSNPPVWQHVPTMGCSGGGTCPCPSAALRWLCLSRPRLLFVPAPDQSCSTTSLSSELQMPVGRAKLRHCGATDMPGATPGSYVHCSCLTASPGCAECG